MEADRGFKYGETSAASRASQQHRKIRRQAKKSPARKPEAKRRRHKAHARTGRAKEAV
jgi:hypothetical protein